MARLETLLRRLNPRERGLLLLVLLTAAFLGGKVFIVDEAVRAFNLWAQIGNAEKEISRSRSMLQDLLVAKPEDFRASPYWNYRKENNGLGNLIRRVSSTSETKRHFTVRRIVMDKTEKLPEFEKTRFEIEVEGPFQSIGEFLEDLENSQFLTKVESVNVSRIEKELRLCRARILVNSFSWREL